MGVERKNEASLHLDERLLHFMDQLELLEEKRDRINSLIEQGWFSISKARYAMGNKQVSTLQYGSEIEPKVYVHVTTLQNGEAEFHTERVELSSSDDSKKHPELVETIGPQEEGVRRRIAVKTKDTEEKPVSSEKLVSKKDTSQPGKLGHQDPLKWFGILVPQSLKQAQSAFKQVIELSAEIASLQSQIVSTKEELQTQKGGSPLKTTSRDP